MPSGLERGLRGYPFCVMAGLVPPAGPKPLRRGEGPAIHAFHCLATVKTWMPGTSPGMTEFALAGCYAFALTFGLWRSRKYRFTGVPDQASLPGQNSRTPVITRL